MTSVFTSRACGCCCCTSGYYICPLFSYLTVVLHHTSLVNSMGIREGLPHGTQSLPVGSDCSADLVSWGYYLQWYYVHCSGVSYLERSQHGSLRRRGACLPARCCLPLRLGGGSTLVLWPGVSGSVDCCGAVSLGSRD